MRKLSMSELNRLSVNEFKQKPKLPVVIVLDNIRSLNNIGGIFRTADAFRISAVHLCGITARPPHREIHKTALGATESVSWKYFNTTMNSLEELRKEKYSVYAVEQTTQSILLSSFRPPEKPLAFIFGNEVKGIDEQLLSHVDGSLEIPQFGTKHSLNVSVSVGIVIWHYFNLNPNLINS